ncbi:MAG: hypothetical protein JOZ02_08000 [Acidobacteria bacterium]|nr:hypothetical protein [Acidobacteriota bacterium]
MDFVLLISQLLTVLKTVKPGLGGDATLLATAVANIIAYIQQQNGLTTEQILKRAGAQLDVNEVELLKDLASLQGGGGTSSGGPGSGSGGAGGAGGSGGGAGGTGGAH